MRVGGGDDFCSREHRNHYRLRRGMDQLQEANQMSSLMRRRENPKPLAAIVPGGEGVSLPRTLLPSAARPAVPVLAGWKPAYRIPSAQPAIVFPLEESRFVQLGLPLNTLVELRKLALKRPSFAGCTTGGMVHRTTPLAGMESCTRQREVLLKPSRGAALRISLQAGFRRPGLLTRGARLELRAGVAVGTITRVRAIAARDYLVEPRQMLIGAELFDRGLVCPAPPGLQPIPGIRRPGPTGLRRPRVIECEPRTLQPARSLREPVANLTIPASTGGMMRPRDSEIRVFVLANPPAGGERAARIASAPFLSQDAPFGFSDEESQHR
jgi:hypothetical protein